jgi:peptidyl-prolyl cis-trans isomerase SurA
MHSTLRQLFLFGALAAAAVFAGCGSPSAPAAPAAPAPPPITADTWAVVDGRQVMRADVDKAFARNRDPNQTLSEEETLIAKLRLLDEHIVQELLIERAPALQITVTDAEIDKAYSDAKSGATDDVFKQELTRRNLTETDVRDSIRRDLTVQKVLQKEVTDKVTVSDQEVTDLFNANKSSFNLPEDAVHIAQIVVTPSRDQQIANRSGNDATTPQEAQSKVATLMQRLQAGDAFADLARAYSEDPESAPRGGDMGLVPLSAIRRAPAALRDVVLNTEPGRAQVVQDGNAVRIVLVVSREKAGQRDLSTPGTKEQLTQAIRMRKEQLLRDAYLNARRADAEVTNYLARRLVEGNGKL